MKIDFANICGITALVISITLILLGVKISQWVIPVWIIVAIIVHNDKK